jgi:hypothetical protein
MGLVSLCFQVSYALMTEDELSAKMDHEVGVLSDVFGLPPDLSRIILQHFNWNGVLASE